MKRVSFLWLVLIQWVLAFEWLHSGWGKWANAGFITNIGKSLEGFAAKTPYAGYGSFLKSTAIPNAEMYGNAIRTGELAVGLALALGGILFLSSKRLPGIAMWLLVVALLGGALMNLNFYLAAGWSSPSTSGINLVMGLVHLILAVAYVANRKEVASM